MLLMPTHFADRGLASCVALLALLMTASCDGGPTEPATDPPSITTTSLPNAILGEAYSESVNATGGDGEFFWSLLDGNLPPGLALSVEDLPANEALITGNPAEVGSYEFRIEVRDGTDRADTAAFELDVVEPQELRVETIAVPPALANFTYDVILTAAGGDEQNFDWRVVNGSLPAGLELGDDGQFSGQPQETGTASFTVEVSSAGETARRTFTLVVAQNEPGRYNITPFPVVTVDGSLQDNVREAIRRWEAAITGDLAGIRIPADTASGGFPSHLCSGFGSLVNGTSLDDLLLIINIDSIDGPGDPDDPAGRNIIGQAGPCGIRNGGTPAIGALTLDEFDLEGLGNEETITDLIQHEIGHVLGFGALWDSDQFGFDLIDGAGGDDPRYTGEEGVAEYQARTGATDSIPVENEGGEGSRDAHWRESVFGDELMTSSIAQPGTDNPFSSMTIASMADLGYEVDLSAADPGTLALRAPGEPEPGTNLGRDIVGVGPIVVFGDDAGLRVIPESDPPDPSP